MNKKQRNLILLVIALLVVAAAVYFYLRNKGVVGEAKDKGDFPDSDGYYYFKFVGGSALRVDSSNNPIPCEYTEAMKEQGTGFPTTFYATLALGSEDAILKSKKYKNDSNCDKDLCYILAGDEITDVEILEGETAIPLEGANYKVIQLGTDSCTSTGTPDYLNNGVVIDLPLSMKGDDEPIYDKGSDVIIGRFKLKTQN
jgi:hypothetical protein